MFRAKKAGYYTPSAVEKEAFITAVTEREFLDPVCNDVFAAEKYMEAVLNTLRSKKVLKSRVE